MPGAARPERRLRDIHEGPGTPADGDRAACMSGYSPCLPITGDLDCTDVRALGRAPVLVSGDDPYRLDSDGNGYGCE